MEGALSEVSVFVGDTIRCQVFISDEQKALSLANARNEVLEVVKSFLPETFLFQRRLGNQTIPIAHGQEDLLSLDKCITADSEGTFRLQIQENGPENGNRSPSDKPENAPKPKKVRQRQQSVLKYFGGAERSSQPDYTAARGRVYLYSERDIERAAGDKRQAYYKFWNEKAEELCSTRFYDTYAKQELHGVIDTSWRVHATSLCVKEAEEEKEVVKSLSKALAGKKMLLSAKTVENNIQLLRDEDTRVKAIDNEINTLRTEECALKREFKSTQKISKSITLKQKELKDSVSDLKLFQDRLRKSVTSLSTARVRALASSDKIKGEKRKCADDSDSDELEQFVDLCDADGVDDDDLAEEAKLEDW